MTCWWCKSSHDEAQTTIETLSDEVATLRGDLVKARSSADHWHRVVAMQSEEFERKARNLERQETEADLVKASLEIVLRILAGEPRDSLQPIIQQQQALLERQRQLGGFSGSLGGLLGRLIP